MAHDNFLICILVGDLSLLIQDKTKRSRPLFHMHQIVWLFHALFLTFVAVGTKPLQLYAYFHPLGALILGFSGRVSFDFLPTKMQEVMVS